ncbi:hypothetical protein [Planktotalea sp.]|uniref:hypothetical protein n=1 Tax=Planktotalea sp. TaxID=2029877 RepID=UPI0025F5AEBA|nr:hypothetical protein [Planktotalea sp.]
MWGKACGVLERVFFALYRRQILTKSKLIASIQKIASPVARPGDSPKHECAIQVGFWLSCLITLNQEYSVQRENGKTSKLESALMLLSTSFLVVRFLKPTLFHTLQRKTASIQT